MAAINVVSTNMIDTDYNHDENSESLPALNILHAETGARESLSPRNIVSKH